MHWIVQRVHVVQGSHLRIRTIAKASLEPELHQGAGETEGSLRNSRRKEFDFMKSKYGSPAEIPSGGGEGVCSRARPNSRVTVRSPIDMSRSLPYKVSRSVTILMCRRDCGWHPTATDLGHSSGAPNQAGDGSNCPGEEGRNEPKCSSRWSKEASCRVRPYLAHTEEPRRIPRLEGGFFAGNALNRQGEIAGH